MTAYHDDDLPDNAANCARKQQKIYTFPEDLSKTATILIPTRGLDPVIGMLARHMHEPPHKTTRNAIQAFLT